jgi:hypothetical protein
MFALVKKYPYFVRKSKGSLAASIAAQNNASFSPHVMQSQKI